MGSKTCKILHQVKNEHHLAKLTRNQKKTSTNRNIWLAKKSVI